MLTSKTGRLFWSAIGLALVVAGCSNTPPRMMQPKYNPNAGKDALTAYDKNGDGFISGKEEFALCPVFLRPAVLKRYEDSPGSGRVSADMINQRIQEWIDSKVAIMSTMVQVKLDGQELEGASVTFEPEPFIGSEVATVTGKTDSHGMANLMIDADPAKPPQERKPGINCGLYKVRISKMVGGKESIPAKYNTNTELGIEAAQGNPDFQMGAQRFDLKSR